MPQDVLGLQLPRRGDDVDACAEHSVMSALLTVRFLLRP
jgi:hypothetical protein